MQQPLEAQEGLANKKMNQGLELYSASFPYAIPPDVQETTCVGDLRSIATCCIKEGMQEGLDREIK